MADQIVQTGLHSWSNDPLVQPPDPTPDLGATRDADGVLEQHIGGNKWIAIGPAHVTEPQDEGTGDPVTNAQATLLATDPESESLENAANVSNAMSDYNAEPNAGDKFANFIGTKAVPVGLGLGLAAFGAGAVPLLADTISPPIAAAAARAWPVAKAVAQKAWQNKGGLGGAIVGGYQGYKQGGALGALEGAALGSITGRSLDALRGAAAVAPDAAETAAAAAGPAPYAPGSEVDLSDAVDRLKSNAVIPETNPSFSTPRPPAQTAGSTILTPQEFAAEDALKKAYQRKASFLGMKNAAGVK